MASAREFIESKRAGREMKIVLVPLSKIKENYIEVQFIKCVKKEC